jgi:hypothetical protein
MTLIVLLVGCFKRMFYIRNTNESLPFFILSTGIYIFIPLVLNRNEQHHDDKEVIMILATE